MRVLVWSDLFWPYIGGPELLMAKLMPELRERGYEFLVVTSHDYLDLPDEGSYEGIRICRFPFRPAIASRNPTAMREARREVADVKRDYCPDLVHATTAGPSLFFHLRTLDAHPAPWLLRLATEVLPSQSAGEDTLLQEALRSATWVTACSQAVLDQSRRLAPEITGRSSVIRHGVALGADPMPKPPQAAPHLLCVGRLVPAKGFDVALEAFATLLTSYPTLRLTIAGDGASRRDLELQAGQLGLGSSVEFLGWVDPDQVADLIDKASIVMVPSRREGLSLAALQAAARARPIVATRVGGLPEIVLHGETGLLVPSGDARALADAAASLLDDPEKAERMGAAARARVGQALSFDRCIEAFDHLYRTLDRSYACSL